MLYSVLDERSPVSTAAITIDRNRSDLEHAMAKSPSATVVIQVKVKPNARTSLIEETPDGAWLAQLKSQPVEGKANEELIALVAKRFGRPKSAVSIKSGASGRVKRVCIQTG